MAVSIESKVDLSGFVQSGHWSDSLADFHEAADPAFGLDQAGRIASIFDRQTGSELARASDAFSFVNLLCNTGRLLRLNWVLVATILKDGMYSEETRDVLLDLSMKVSDVAADFLNCVTFVIKNVSVAVAQFAIVFDAIPRIRTIIGNITFLGTFQENAKDGEEVKKVKNHAYKKHLYEALKQGTRLTLGALLIAGVAMNAFTLIMFTFAYYGFYRGSYIYERKVQAFIAERGLKSI